MPTGSIPIVLTCFLCRGAGYHKKLFRKKTDCPVCKGKGKGGQVHWISTCEGG